MDNGLIFPYPQVRAHAEPADTNIVDFLAGFRVGVGGEWWA
jgi:hypothetical protein